MMLNSVRTEAVRSAPAKRDLAKEMAAAKNLLSRNTPEKEDVINRVTERVARAIADDAPVVETASRRRTTAAS